MKNFDNERRPVTLTDEEMRFTLGGETFTRRDKVRPEGAAMIADSDFEPAAHAVIDMMEKGILEFVLPEDADRWNALRGKEWPREFDAEKGEWIDVPDPYAELREQGRRNALELWLLQSVARWLLEVETRLPTTRPSASTDGPSSTAQSSTDASSSEEAIQAA